MKIDRRGFMRLIGIGAGAAVAASVGVELPEVVDEPEEVHVKFDRSETAYRYVNGEAVSDDEWRSRRGEAVVVNDADGPFVHVFDEQSEDGRALAIDEMITLIFDNDAPLMRGRTYGG